MNHKSISFVKSAIRILCMLAGVMLIPVNIVASISVGFIGLGAAEVLGIFEEIFDRRK